MIILFKSGTKLFLFLIYENKFIYTYFLLSFFIYICLTNMLFHQNSTIDWFGIIRNTINNDSYKIDN